MLFEAVFYTTMAVMVAAMVCINIYLYARLTRQAYRLLWLFGAVLGVLILIKAVPAAWHAWIELLLARGLLS